MRKIYKTAPMKLVKLGFLSVLSMFVIYSACLAVEYKYLYTYGCGTSDNAYYTIPLKDGSIIIVGQTQRSMREQADIRVLKVDIQGQFEWSRTYGGRKFERALCVKETQDDGFIIAGETESYGKGSFEAFLLKINAIGDVEWFNTYGGPAYDSFNSVEIASDGGFIAAGRTDNFGARHTDLWLVKTDEKGKMLWNNRFGGGKHDEAFSVINANDEGYVVTGYTRSFGAGDDDIWLLKTDKAGKEVWNKTFGGEFEDKAKSLIATNDGGYLITGYTKPKQDKINKNKVKSFMAGYLLKTDGSGNQQWAEELGDGGSMLVGTVANSSNTGYIAVGNHLAELLIVQCDLNGKQTSIEQTPMEGSGYTIPQSITKTLSGAFYISGTASDAFALIKFSE